MELPLDGEDGEKIGFRGENQGSQKRREESVSRGKEEPSDSAMWS